MYDDGDEGLVAPSCSSLALKRANGGALRATCVSIQSHGVPIGRVLCTLGCGLPVGGDSGPGRLITDVGGTCPIRRNHHEGQFSGPLKSRTGERESPQESSEIGFWTSARRGKVP